MDEDTNMMHANQKEWIQSWLMDDQGCKNFFVDIQPAHEYPLEQIHALAESVGMDSRSQQDVVKEALQKRYETFVRDRNSITNLLLCNDHYDEMKDLSLLEDVYKLVLSRSASLGPQWNHQRGIIPFHDMVNHPPSGSQSNVKLFSFADIKETIGYDAAIDMICKLAQAEQRTNDKTDGTATATTAFADKMDDKDLLLVATREIYQGDELWLSYKQFSAKEDDSRQKLWWTLQYGFPIT
jgi:hypothetical protein